MLSSSPLREQKIKKAATTAGLIGLGIGAAMSIYKKSNTMGYLTAMVGWGITAMVAGVIVGNIQLNRAEKIAAKTASETQTETTTKPV